MAFDSKAFLRAKYVPREGEVPVEALKEFFGEDEKAVWRVRSLTGQELGVANASAEKSKNLTAIVEAVQGRHSEKVEAFKKVLGLSDDTPPDIAKRLELFLIGSIEPNVQEEGGIELALAVCKRFPIEFYLITTKILELTGQGHIVGKPKPSGKKKTSNTA